MDEERQATFGDDGTLDTETPPEARAGTTDDGEPKDEHETNGGYNRYDVSSLLQKAVRRSDERVAAWAAWELARSGYAWNLWNRLTLYVVEDLRAGQDVALHVERYETLATERWEPDSWEGRLCAIHAALACARARSSREAANADECFRAIAERRAETPDGEEPPVDFPAGELEPGGDFDVVFDQHTGEGSRLGRGTRFFKTRGARVGPDEDGAESRRWQRLAMALSDVDYTDAELDHALAAVSAEDPWEEPAEGDLRE